MGDIADEHFERMFEDDDRGEGGFFSKKPNYTRRHYPMPQHRAILQSGSLMMKFELINETYQTDKAHLLVFEFEGRRIERWLPKSQIKIPFADVVEIPQWLVDRIREELRGQDNKQQDGDGADNA